jgi:hypothetical protein
LRQINGIWMSLPINTGGFELIGSVSDVTYEYTTINCSGTIFVHGGDLIEQPAIFGATQAGAYFNMASRHSPRLLCDLPNARAAPAATPITFARTSARSTMRPLA